MLLTDTLPDFWLMICQAVQYASADLFCLNWIVIVHVVMVLPVFVTQWSCISVCIYLCLCLKYAASTYKKYYALFYSRTWLVSHFRPIELCQLPIKCNYINSSSLLLTVNICQDIVCLCVNVVVVFCFGLLRVSAESLIDIHYNRKWNCVVCCEGSQVLY